MTAIPSFLRKLGELIEIRHGYAFDGAHFTSIGSHIVVTPGNFNEEGGFKQKDGKEKWYSGPVRADYILKKGDLIVAMTEQAEGLLGSSAIVPQSDRYLHNQRIGLVLIRDREQLDQRFAYYLFNTKPVRQQIRASATGAKIRHTAPSRIAEVRVYIPGVRAQRRIAATLSAYDELIESCSERIRILETMARALYREWFVDFRFPGHKVVPRVNSPIGKIPRGWSVKNLADLCQITMGQSPKSEFYNETGDGNPFHQGVTDFGIRFPSDRLYCTVEGRVAERGDILFSVRAPVGRLNIANKRIVIGRGLSAIRRRDGHQAFLWEQLCDRFTEDDMIGNGSIFAAVTKADVEKIELISPASSVLELAQRHLEPMHDEIATLSKQISNLRQTRDLLLPRLLSHQVEPHAIAKPNSIRQ